MNSKIIIKIVIFIIGFGVKVDEKLFYCLKSQIKQSTCKIEIYNRKFNDFLLLSDLPDYKFIPVKPRRVGNLPYEHF